MLPSIVVNCSKSYEPTALLGKGTYGTVFRARAHSKCECSNNNKVIIKLSRLDTVESVEMFVSEVLLNVYLRQIECRKRPSPDHCHRRSLTPNTVTAIGYGFTVYAPIGGASPLGYMVYADDNAMSLRNALIDHRDAIMRQSISIMIMTAHALRELHSVGVIHGDVSSGNMVAIMDSNAWVTGVKIIDLGSAYVDDDHVADIIYYADTFMLRALSRKINSALTFHQTRTTTEICAVEFISARIMINEIDAKELMRCSGIAERPGLDPVYRLENTALQPDAFSRRADMHALGALYAELLSSVFIVDAETLAAARAVLAVSDNAAARTLINILLDDREPISVDTVIEQLEQILDQ